MEYIKKFIGFNPDFIGSMTAIVCAIHCMMFPLLLSIGLVNSTHHNHAFDLIFMAAGLGIAAYVFIKDFRQHGDIVPLLISIIGFAVLYVGVQSHGSLFFLSITGGVLITIAHFKNWKLSHKH